MSLLSSAAGWVGKNLLGMGGARPGILSVPTFTPGATNGGKLTLPGQTGTYTGGAPGFDLGDLPIIGGIVEKAQDWLNGKMLGSTAADAISQARKTGLTGLSDAELLERISKGDQNALVSFMGRYPNGAPADLMMQAGIGPGLISTIVKRAGPIIAGGAAGAGMEGIFGALFSGRNGKKKHRRMNVLNPKALKRADRRVTGFASTARPILRDLGYTVTTHRHVKPKMKKKRR